MMTYFTDEYMSLALNEIVIETIPFKRRNIHEGAPLSITVMSLLTTQKFNGDVRLTKNKINVLLSLFYGVMRWQRSAKQGRSSPQDFIVYRIYFQKESNGFNVGPICTSTAADIFSVQADKFNLWMVFILISEKSFKTLNATEPPCVEL